MATRSRNSAASLFVAVAAAAFLAGPLAGCGQTSKVTDVVAINNRVKRTLRRPYIGIRAPETHGGSEYDMVPLDMWGPCRWEATFGLFDETRTNGLNGAFFGTNLDSRRGPTHEYYGIYASVQAGTINVSSEAEGATTGGIVFPGFQSFAGAKRIDAAIDLDGTTMSFYARDADVGGPYLSLGSLPFSSQQHPLNPGIEVSDLKGNAEIGFTNLKVVSNSAPPTPVGKAHKAVNEVLEALLALSNVKSALADEDTAIGAVLKIMDTALAQVSQVRGAVAAVPANGPRTKEARTKATQLARLAKTRLRSARAELARKRRKGVAAASAAVGMRAYDLVIAADRILPAALRDSLPGTRDTLLR